MRHKKRKPTFYRGLSFLYFLENVSYSPFIRRGVGGEASYKSIGAGFQTGVYERFQSQTEF